MVELIMIRSCNKYDTSTGCGAVAVGSARMIRASVERLNEH